MAERQFTKEGLARPDEIIPQVVAQKIVAGYLNGVGWAREWERTIWQELVPENLHRAREEKFRRAQKMREDAEDQLVEGIEKWLQSKDKLRYAVLEEVYKKLSPRHDLTLIAQKMLARIKNALPPV
ncbi:MAG: hypothetical protein WC901_01285 [Candidatus Margulisiibacteriota bacterium]